MLRSHDGLLAARHLRRCLDVEIPFRCQTLDEVVEQLGELGLRGFVPVASQRLEHLRRELPTLDQGIEDRLAERVERTVLFTAKVAPIGIVVVTTGESRLEEKVRQLVEERLQVDRVGGFGAETRVRVESHHRRNIGRRCDPSIGSRKRGQPLRGRALSVQRPWGLREDRRIEAAGRYF